MEQHETYLEQATLGAGCFWCVEAVFQNLKGVESVASGYTGGQVEDPSYEAVCSGTTGHAEVAQITYDPKIISYEELLEVFWQTHDPTTLNQQGNDKGTQYRSVIYYHDDSQLAIAQSQKKALNDANTWNAPVVTEISPLKIFYPAENYHQNYYNTNSNQPYCTFVVKPKLDKFKHAFGHKVKNAMDTKV